MENRFETFTVLVNRISRNIRRIKNQEMAEYDLRSAHISCLYYLYANPGLTATDLCERCEEDKATISRALEYLEDNGYLRCESKTAKKSGCSGEKQRKAKRRMTLQGTERKAFYENKNYR